MLAVSGGKPADVSGGKPADMVGGKPADTQEAMVTEPAPPEGPRGRERRLFEHRPARGGSAREAFGDPAPGDGSDPRAGGDLFSRPAPEQPARPVAAGGWRRALVATALGAVAGLAVAAWMSHEGSRDGR